MQADRHEDTGQIVQGWYQHAVTCVATVAVPSEVCQALFSPKFECIGEVHFACAVYGLDNETI